MSNLVRVEMDESEQVRVAEEVSQAVAIHQQAQAFKVKTKEDAEEVSARVNAIAPRVRALEEARKELTRPLDASKKGIISLFAKAIDPLEAAVVIYKRKANEWLVNEREKAEALQAKELAKAEKKQLELEAKRLAAEEAGDLGKAEALADKAANVVAKIVETPKVEGLKTKSYWTAEVTNLPILMAYIIKANDLTVLAAIEVKTSKLVEIARMTEGKAVIPGVTFRKVEMLTR